MIFFGNHGGNVVGTQLVMQPGCLDKGDFLRMMCPDGYRLPSMQGEVGTKCSNLCFDPNNFDQDRDVFGMLLTGSIRYLSDAISTEEAEKTRRQAAFCSAHIIFGVWTGGSSGASSQIFSQMIFLRVILFHK